MNTHEAKQGRISATDYILAAAFSALWLLTATFAHAQTLTSDQQKCVTSLHKRGAKVAATQGKENTRCIKDAGRKKLIGQTAQECLEADPRGKVQKATTATLTTETKSCTAPLPPYGYTSGNTVNASMVDDELGLVDDTFGDPLETAIIIAAIDSDGAKCQAAVSKAYEKVASTRNKEFNRCAKGGLKAGTIDESSDLAACIGVDARGKVGKAKQKTVDTAIKRCAGVDPADAFPSLCSSSADTTALGNCLAAAADCRTCRAISFSGAVIGACDEFDDGIVNGSCAQCGNGNIDPGEECDDAEANSDTTPDACRTTCALPTCGDSVTDTGETCDDGGDSPTCDSNCTPAVCGDGTTNTVAGESCDEGGPALSCDGDCTPVVCGDGTTNPAAGEGCDDGNTTPSDGCDAQCDCEAGFSGPNCQADLCPASTSVFLHAQTTGIPCLTNGDCSIGVCNTTVERCTTVTELDSGWTGIAHDSDVNDGVVTFANLHCIGPFDGGSPEPCGDCFVTGLEAAGGSCRCANDNTQRCDEPFSPDVDDCGGANCDCYLGPPLPLSSGNTPACIVNRFAADLSGTVNVDTGDARTTVNLKAVVFLGESIIQPCPYCSNDPVHGDGKRGGTCIGGANDTLACDVDAVNQTFPAPSGAGHSLDCFPSTGKNVSGTGLTIDLEQTTGSAALGSAVPCGFTGSPELCHCGVCDGNSTLPCTQDADCGQQGPCRSTSQTNPRPNQCSDLVCTDIGGGEGECLAGPLARFCDGITRANGDGFVSCLNNGDCTASSCGPVSCGACTLSSNRECFQPTISASGTPHPDTPISASLFCAPPTANGAINTVAGLPGPGRVINQSTTVANCALAPSFAYAAGVGGCPATTTTTTTLNTTTTTTTTLDTTTTTLPIVCGLTFPVCNGGCGAGLSCQMSGLACECLP